MKEKNFKILITSLIFIISVVCSGLFGRQTMKDYIIYNLKIEDIQSTNSEYVNVKINIDNEVNNYLFKII